MNKKHIYIVEWWNGNENTSEYFIGTNNDSTKYQEARDYLAGFYGVDIDIEDVIAVYCVRDLDIKRVYKTLDIDNKQLESYLFKLTRATIKHFDIKTDGESIADLVMSELINIKQ